MRNLIRLILLGILMFGSINVVFSQMRKDSQASESKGETLVNPSKGPNGETATNTDAITLENGRSLLRGESMISRNREFALKLNDAGNLVLTNNTTGTVSWETKTEKATNFVVQSDGNLVLYDGTKPVWSSQTYGKCKEGVARLRLLNSGVLSLECESTVIWTSSPTQPVNFPDGP